MNLKAEDNLEMVDGELQLPRVTLAREKLLEEVSKKLQAVVQGEKKSISLVAVGKPYHLIFLDILSLTQGHVDAGKSTLMGRMLYEMGKVNEKERLANERASGKIGKSSFSWAWQLDDNLEERERLEFLLRLSFCRTDILPEV
jgi:elongation factor 1 alpha-like protein